MSTREACGGCGEISNLTSYESQSNINWIFLQSFYCSKVAFKKTKWFSSRFYLCGILTVISLALTIVTLQGVSQLKGDLTCTNISKRKNKVFSLKLSFWGKSSLIFCSKQPPIYGVLVVSFIILLVVSISILYSVGPTRK